jgi:uncharacterized protein YndB with AHSA1/START domain
MSVAIPNKVILASSERVIGASVFAPVPPRELFEVVRDVRSFPEWACGVRRVEVLERPGETRMVSEWEISFLGIRKKVSSVLEEIEPFEYLRWSYDGPVAGWGECAIGEWADGALAQFRTGISSTDSRLEALMRSPLAKGAASSQLRRSLSRLGGRISGDAGRVRVGPLSHSG